MDYTHATGNIGNYKGTVVHAMTKAEYFSYKQYSNNMIYLITDEASPQWKCYRSFICCRRGY